MDFKEVVYDLWDDIADQNADKLKMYFSEDAIIDCPNTNESFYVDEYIRANCEYPGKISGSIERIEQIYNLVIAVIKVNTDKDSEFHVTSFIDFHNDEIIKITEYWAEDGKIPQWRMDMKIGRPIEL